MFCYESAVFFDIRNRGGIGQPRLYFAKPCKNGCYFVIVNHPALSGIAGGGVKDESMARRLTGCLRNRN